MPGEDRPLITPAIAGVTVTVIITVVSAFAHLTYTPLRSELNSVKDAVSQMKADPAPKPETRVKIEDMEGQIDRLSDRVNRLDERLNNLHMYILQTAPRELPSPLLLPRRRNGAVDTQKMDGQ